MYFTDEEIRNYALPTVIDYGKELYERNAVIDLKVLRCDVVAAVKENVTDNVIISKKENRIDFDCTCLFFHGGACHHVVAAMMAVNNKEKLQCHSRCDTDENENNTENHAGIIKSIRSKPTGRLYLAEHDSLLIIELRFAYKTGVPQKPLVEFTRYNKEQHSLVAADTSVINRIVRSKARENELVIMLGNYRVKPYQHGFFTPIDDPRSWVDEMLPQISEHGFELFGHKDLLIAKSRRMIAPPCLKIDSKDDGFACSLSFHYEGIPASLAALIQAIQYGNDYIQLSDGSSGVIPDHLKKILEKIFAIVKTDTGQNCFYITKQQAALIDIIADNADIAFSSQHAEKIYENVNAVATVARCEVPKDFRGTMRTYQQAGYEWLCFLRQCGFGGCLADDMGLGKTVQTIALLVREKMYRNKAIPDLVIVPTSVLFNWEREIKTFAPRLLVAKYYGSNRARMQGTLGHADVILTTYGVLSHDTSVLEQMDFNYLILDEAQTIKNPSSRITAIIRSLQVRFRLVLTGTPVENNLRELWSLFSFINPGMLGPLRNFIKHFALPIERESDTDSVEMLRKMIFPFVLRRTKNQVATELPPKTETVIFTDMLPSQQRLYDITKEAFLSKIIDSVEKYGIERSGMHILKGMLRLRQICCHPLLVDPNYDGDSGKYTVVDEYLDDIIAEKHRVLLFSQFEKVLQLMKCRLEAKAIRSELLSGKTYNRAAVVDRFQNTPDIAVFLISLKAGGVGLNLTEADYVIHLDPWWNPAVENQATDRAYRIGQKKPVFVYKFITKNSIEEKVLERQKQKQRLTDTIIVAEQSFFKDLTYDDIVELFS